MYKIWGLFPEKLNFMFADHFVKVSIILKMIQWKYQLTKQNRPVCELGTVLLYCSTGFDYKFAFEPKKFLGLLRNGTQVCFLSDLLKINPLLCRTLIWWINQCKPFTRLQIHVQHLKMKELWTWLKILLHHNMIKKVTNNGYTMAVQKHKISLWLFKNISWVSTAPTWNIFQHKKGNFISRSRKVFFIV